MTTATDDYDAVVVGAGPAGSTTARGLALRGVRALLVDRSRFPRPKVCGCCLNPRALAVLERTGLGGLAERLGAVALTGLELASGSRRAAVDHPLGVALSRDALDAALVAAATEAGAEFVPGVEAALIPASEPGPRAVRLRSGEGSREVRGRFVVSATGLGDGLFPAGSRTAPAPGSKIGAGAILAAAPRGYEPGRIHMACGEGGYVGLVVLEDGRLDMAAALGPVAVRNAGGIGPLAGKILAASPLPPAPEAAEARWRGTAALTRSAVGVVQEGVFRVGDSAGYVEPFTGEGMAWALAGGEALAELLAEAVAGDEPRPADRWPAAHRRIVGRRQRVCRGAGVVLRTPWMTRLLVAALERRPTLARPLLTMMHSAR